MLVGSAAIMLTAAAGCAERHYHTKRPGEKAMLR